MALRSFYLENNDASALVVSAASIFIDTYLSPFLLALTAPDVMYLTPMVCVHVPCHRCAN